jgi:hypothetical protein
VIVTVLVVVEISFIKNVSFVVEFVVSTIAERVELTMLVSALSCLTLSLKAGMGLLTTSVVTTVRSVYDVETSVMNWVSVGDGWNDVSVAKSRLCNVM